MRVVLAPLRRFSLDCALPVRLTLFASCPAMPTMHGAGTPWPLSYGLGDAQFSIPSLLQLLDERCTIQSNLPAYALACLHYSHRLDNTAASVSKAA